MTDTRRHLPSVDAVLRHPDLRALVAMYDRTLVAGLVRTAIDTARRDGSEGEVRSVDALAAHVVDEARARWRVAPRPVINASGVILHTNLGRAPLSKDAAAAALGAATGYSDLEFDLASGKRGSRNALLSHLLHDLTGAEDGLAVNNTAAALVLTLAALCRRREVVVSRGQAVEIGGGFRIPEIMRETGARLVEVGTTNRTRLADYAAAITPRIAGLLYVHSSNFRIVGFTESVDMAALAALAREHDVPLIADIGSGALRDVRRYGLSAEPLVQETVAAGADLVLFSGDKLLGGPQAGIVLGRAALIGRLRAHPLMRASRLDKVTIAMLSATLLHYVRGEEEREVPVWRMIAARPDDIAVRARRWCDNLPAVPGVLASVETVQSTVGGGSLPGEMLPSYALALRAEGRPAAWASAVAAALRVGTHVVVARIDDDRVLLDPRTVAPDEEDALLEALSAVLCQVPPRR